MSSHTESSPRATPAAIELRARVDALVAALSASPSPTPGGSGAADADALATIEMLFLALEAGTVRAAERASGGAGGHGTWRAVPWVKRGILAAFRVGTLVDQ